MPSTDICRLMMLALVAAACGGAPGTSQWAGTRDTVAGAEIVRNPAAPLLDSTQVTATSLWSSPAAETESPWELPRWIAVGFDRVAVLDLAASRVYLLDAATGTELRILGRAGEGPGEFRNAFGLAIRDSEVLVGNGGGSRLNRYGFDGTSRRAVPLQVRPFLFTTVDRDQLFGTGLGGGPQAAAWVLATDGSATPVTLPDSSLAVASIDYADCPRFGGTAVGLLRLQCQHLGFQLLDPVDHLKREVVVDRPPDVATEAELGVLRQQWERNLGSRGLTGEDFRQMVDRQVSAARVKEVFQGIRGDARTGRVHVLEQDPPYLADTTLAGRAPLTARLHVFSADGRYLARVGFPRRWEDFVVRGDTVFALEQDPETGLVEVGAHALHGLP